MYRAYALFHVQLFEQRLLLRDIHIEIGREKISKLLGLSMFKIIRRACSGASGASSNNLAAESRKFRNVASHSLLAAGIDRFGQINLGAQKTATSRRFCGVKSAATPAQ